MVNVWGCRGEGKQGNREAKKKNEGALAGYVARLDMPNESLPGVRIRFEPDKRRTHLDAAGKVEFEDFLCWNRSD